MESLNFLSYLFILLAIITLLKILAIVTTKKLLITPLSHEFFFVIAGIVLIYFFTMGSFEQIMNSILVLIMFSALFIVISNTTKGILIYGATSGDVQRATIDILEKMGEKVEQIPGHIYLPEKKITISSSFSDRYGYGRIVLKGKIPNKFIEDFCNDLRKSDIQLNRSYIGFALFVSLSLFALFMLRFLNFFTH